MSAYDATGMERIPFDCSYDRPADTRIRYSAPHHGPQCRPSNPEIGCECGEDERQSLNAEARDLGFRSYDALVNAMGDERMAALARTHNPTICPNPRRCPNCSEAKPQRQAS